MLRNTEVMLRPRVVTVPILGCKIVATSLLLTGGLLLAANGARAQSVDQAPPPHSAIDTNGVDLISGSLNFADTQVAIGKPGGGGLTRRYFGGPVLGAATGRDSLAGTINSTVVNVYTVSLGGISNTYSLSGGIFTSLQGDGSTLTLTNSTTYTWVRRDGTTGVFSTLYKNGLGVFASVARIVSLTHASGEIDTYTYSLHAYSPLSGFNGYRLDAITNNFGYEMKYLYQTSTGTITDYTLQKIIGINNAVDYCAPTATSCTALTVTWPSVTFSAANPNVMTDALGRQTTYIKSTANSTQTLIRPSGATFSVTFDASTRVTAISNGTGTWHYAYVDSGTTRTSTVTDPLGHTRVVVSDTGTTLMASDTDGLSHETSYAYDSFGRLTKVTRPEGDFTSYTYDARGNVTQTVVTGKDLVSTLTSSHQS
jgi:YD repeat-containing protein